MIFAVLQNADFQIKTLTLSLLRLDNRIAE